jgi:hypothetical protein
VFHLKSNSEMVPISMVCESLRDDEAHRRCARHIGDDAFCPGCGNSKAIDLRTIDRHPLASVGTLVLGLRCSWFPGSAPMPKLTGLFALPPGTRADASDRA